MLLILSKPNMYYMPKFNKRLWKVFTKRIMSCSSHQANNLLGLRTLLKDLKCIVAIAFLKNTLTYHNKAKYFLTSLASVRNGKSQTYSTFKIKKWQDAFLTVCMMLKISLTAGLTLYFFTRRFIAIFGEDNNPGEITVRKNSFLIKIKT